MLNKSTRSQVFNEVTQVNYKGEMSIQFNHKEVRLDKAKCWEN